MDLHRGSQIMYVYILFQSALNLFRICGHLFATSAVNHCHFFTTESSGGPCRINGNITAAYNHNPVPGFSTIPEIDIPEKIHSIQDTLKVILTRDICFNAGMGANCQKDGLKALFFQV